MFAFLRKIGIFRRFLKKPDDSASRAKERLRIVLIQDQASVSSELLEVLRTEMIGVVSQYLDIDLDNLEMGLERTNGSIALAANIPVIRIKSEGRSLVPERVQRPAAMQGSKTSSKSTERRPRRKRV